MPLPPVPPQRPQPPALMAAVELPAPEPVAAPPVVPGAVSVADPEPEPETRPEPQPTATTTATQAPKPKPKVSIPLEVDELLDWADKEGPARAQTLASRTRVALAELGAIHAKHTETSDARKAVAALEKQLADAKAELRRLTAAKQDASTQTEQDETTAPAEAAHPLAASTSEIRAWARQNGHDVSDRGRLAPAVIGAYQAAHTA